MNQSTLLKNAQQIENATHPDPYAFLGLHCDKGSKTVRVTCFVPDAKSVSIINPQTGKQIKRLAAVKKTGVYSTLFKELQDGFAYQIKAQFEDGYHIFYDPYRFPNVLGETDCYLIAEGNHQKLYDKLGAHLTELQNVEGVSFAVWAPAASRVAVVGDFNHWDGRRHCMRKRHENGIWEIFIPGLQAGEHYKYEIKDQHGHLLPLKADPYGLSAQFRPETASIITQVTGFEWSDNRWMQSRQAKNARDAAISIYEVHLGSWKRTPQNQYLNYRELADELIPYVKSLGFTHIQLMPISEFPYDGSWGYQPVGLFAPTSRFGSIRDFQYFVNQCHQQDIGLLIDWVPGHFPTDAHGLGQFDGTALYEHEDPRQGFHPDWNTLIYNYGRTEVSNMLRSNALFWLDHYHIDGLRVDAVASMLYLDYSREEGEWVANKYGGNENLDAVEFLKRTNCEIAANYQGAITIAEESTAFPSVSHPIEKNGLGFNYKWNMGWMHDTLQYMQRDPIHRHYHKSDMSFGLVYAFNENFVLPLSHDEVVHGKGSLLAKMPGDTWQQFANLRAYYGFMWTHPGKKLLFMGGEFAQGREWNYESGLDWHLLDVHWHAGVLKLIKDLNHNYQKIPALHQKDCDANGFCWLEHENNQDSIFAYIRFGQKGTPPAVVVCNLSPQPHQNYRIGLPEAGFYAERINTDSEIYGGSNQGNGGGIQAQSLAWQGQPYSTPITVPPLATVVFELIK
ncbi:1,4-alpha-glucan branching protein GlgB [Catenovulum sediminis]|uniref:1,4-alpha-glucan branching enzyme GlgB n=1 Tax=Catenovulum sediminis TaxID=1740262 RepID=A0ABV1RMG8_9ALTE